MLKRTSLVACVIAVAACGSSKGTPPQPPTPPFEPGSPWPKFRGNAAQDGSSHVHATTKGGALWSFPTGKGIFSSPVVGADGTIYIGSADRTFYAINPDGALKWKLQTGEIIDSAALLDDKGRVYFGSGDGKLRALDARTGNVVWTMAADDPKTNKAFINWFEGNVALGPSGTLYVPNDNFFVYAVDRDTGNVGWRFKMPDQTWSLPAIDAAETLFIGNNNLLPALGKNTFSIDRSGAAQWAKGTLGTIAASPMLTPEGAMVVGGFDGFLRAYDTSSGDQTWELGTRDHIYASPARLPDGTVVQPSTDGTIYGVDPRTGAVKWTFDNREPVRSSPAVDADGNVYVGLGEGRLLVLNANGTPRWSMRLIDDDRDDLNASPALGKDAIYIAGESGQVFSMPYDYCLRPEGVADARCAPETLAGDGASLLFTTRFGRVLDAPPASIDANDAVTLSLVVRAGGTRQLALLDTSSIAVTTDPPAAVDVTVAGDGKFFTVTPKTGFLPGPDGTVALSVKAGYLEGFARAGLKLSGGAPAGSASATMKLAIAGKGATTLAIPQNVGDPATTWEVSRLAVPLPTVMPSYNQIGFDSLHYLVGLVEGSGGRGVAWMTGASLDASNAAVIDPASQAIFAFQFSNDGGLLTLLNEDGLRVEVMSNAIPFKNFRVAAHLGADGNAVAPAVLSGSTVCGDVPFYGPFLQTLGLCNPQTDLITFFGGANFTKWAGGTQSAPTGIGTVTFEATGAAVTARLAESTLRLDRHLASVLLVDDATGRPVSLGYGLDTTRTANADGTLATVTVPLTGHAIPAKARAYLMVDTYPAAKGALTLR